MTLTKFDVGGGFWELSDKDVLQVLNHLPNIQNVGIFTYQILSTVFFEWVKQRNTIITVTTKFEYMSTCSRSKAENEAFELENRCYVTYVTENK